MKHKSALKRILHYIAGYRFYLAASLILAVLTVALTLYAPVLTGDAIDYMIGIGQVDFEALTALLIRLGVVVGATSLFQWLMNLCNNHMTYKVVMDVRTEAFDHMQDLPLSYIDSHPQGDIVSRLIADIDQFSDGLLMGFTQLFTGVMTIFGTLLFMLSVNVWITLVVVCVTPVSFLVANFIAKNTHKMFQLQSETRGELTGLIDEMVGNQKVVKAFGYEEESVSRFDSINRRLEKHSLRAIFFSSITNPATRFVNSLVYAGVGVAGASECFCMCSPGFCVYRSGAHDAGSGGRTGARKGGGTRGPFGGGIFLHEGAPADSGPESPCGAGPADRHRGPHGLRKKHADQSADALL